MMRAYKPNTPRLHYSNTPVLLLHVGESSFERSEVPEILGLQVFAFQCAGQTVKLQIIVCRMRHAAVIGEDAVLHGFFKERKDFVFHLGRKIFEQVEFLSIVENRLWIGVDGAIYFY